MREDLIREIEAQGGLWSPRNPAPVVSLELFFEGNDEEGSIGCNLMKHPGIDIFYDVLNFARRKEEVQDVLVEIHEVEDEFWPYSERVYILSLAPEREIMSWLDILEPADITEGYRFGQPFHAPTLNAGYKVYSIWWD